MELFGVGGWEFVVIAVVAVLIVGPEKLPKMLAEGLKWLRVLRVQATNARREIAAAADLDPAMTDELRRSVSEIAELHPRRIAASFLEDATGAGPATAPKPAVPPVPPPPVNSFGASAASSSFAPRPADAPVARESSPGASFDPDAT